MFAKPIQNCQGCPVGATCEGRCPLTPRFVGAGSVLAASGEVHPNVYLVRQGLLAFQVRRGKEVRVAGLRGPRTLVGIEALQVQPMAMDLAAFTDAWVCGVSASDLQMSLSVEPHLPAAVFGLVAQSAVESQRELASAVDRALARVAKLVLAVGERDPRTPPLRKSALARMLNLRPETFSRCLRQLTDLGLIDARGCIRVLDAPGLEKVARGELGSEEEVEDTAAETATASCADASG